jgi:hypothetical protein
MLIARVLTPFHHRRNPSTAGTSARVVVPAVPFSPRSSSLPPSTAPPPPPTPAHPLIAEMATADPLTMIPSSSSGGVDFELPHAGFSPVSVLKAGTVLTVKIRQPSHEFTFGVGMSFIPYPLVLTPVV